MPKVVAIDWSHEQENLAVFGGRKVTNKMPPRSADLVIVTENIPVKQARPYIEKGATILRCNTDETEKVRRAKGLEKTHANDARIIFDLYRTNPEKFREFKIDPELQQLKVLYATFKGLQEARKATANRVKQEEFEIDSALAHLDAAERDIEKRIAAAVAGMPIYEEFARDIKGIGAGITAGLVGYLGDVDRFPSLGHARAYFGLDVRDGMAPRKQAGQRANWHHKGRALVIGVVGFQIVRNKTPKYFEIYEAEFASQMLLGLAKDEFHAKNRAKRKAAKAFFADFFHAYKRLGRVRHLRETQDLVDRPSLESRSCQQQPEEVLLAA